MTRSYPTPAAFKQALEHRLRQLAAGEGAELARMRQLLVFDRFLARVGAVFGDRVIVKGGLALEFRLARARTTKDVDLRLPADPESLLDRLREAGRMDLGDFLRFEIREDPRHPAVEAEGMLYQGRRFRAGAFLGGKIYGSPFGVDVAFGEPMAGVVGVDGVGARVSRSCPRRSVRILGAGVLELGPGLTQACLNSFGLAQFD